MIVSLRPAQDSDMELVMAWRSHPLVYEGTYTQRAPLTWEEHYAWWMSRGPWWRILIIQMNDEKMRIRDVGVVTVGQLDYWEPEIGIYIGEVSLWGSMVAHSALLEALELLKGLGYKYTRTTILNSNERSKRLFSSVGYVYMGEARPGEGLYRKVL